MITANERRELEKEYMSRMREFTLQNLMDEFHVSRSTARRDIEILSAYPYCIPIESMSGHGGCHCIIGDWRADHKYFSTEQSALIHEYLKNETDPGKRAILESMLLTFDLPAV